MIVDDLSSDVEDAVGAGAEALRHWIHLANAGLSERPPTQAVDALLHRVVFWRRIGVESCLRQLTLLLAEQPEFFGSCHVDLMVASLSPWSESVSASGSRGSRRRLPRERATGPQSSIGWVRGCTE